jgi:hypothetical protein
LQTLQGEILQNTFHISRLKTAFVRSENGKVVQTVVELRRNSSLENTSLLCMTAIDQYGNHIQIMDSYSSNIQFMMLPKIVDPTLTHIDSAQSNDCSHYVSSGYVPHTCYFNVHKARYNNGILEIACVKGNNHASSFWVQPHKYPSFNEMFHKIRTEFLQGIKITGSKSKFERRIVQTLLSN